VEWFDSGGTLPLEDTTRGEDLLTRAARIPGLIEGTRFMGVADRAPAPRRASAIEFILEALAATKPISRTDDRGYQAADSPAPGRTVRRGRTDARRHAAGARREEEILQLSDTRVAPSFSLGIDCALLPELMLGPTYDCDEI